MRSTISLYLILKDAGTVVLGRRAASLRKPGLLQPTVHGGLEEGENELQALERELAEESGLSMADISDPEFMAAGVSEDFEVSYYIAFIDESVLAKMKSTPEVEEFIPVDEERASGIKAHEDAVQEGLDMKATDVMFADELDVLKRIFARLPSS